jgi:hypothetical protein
VASLDELFSRTEEFEELGFKLGHLRRLRQEREEAEEAIRKAQDSIMWLTAEINKQVKVVERQLTTIERSTNG